MAKVEMDLFELKYFILTKISTDLSDDHDFLRKVNRITFGLISEQKKDKI